MWDKTGSQGSCVLSACDCLITACNWLSTSFTCELLVQSGVLYSAVKTSIVEAVRRVVAFVPLGCSLELVHKIDSSPHICHEVPEMFMEIETSIKTYPKVFGELLVLHLFIAEGNEQVLSHYATWEFILKYLINLYDRN